MSFSVEWESDALESLRKIDSSTAQRIFSKIIWLSANLANIKPVPLKGSLKVYFKLVVGDYRVLYSISRTEQIIVIHDVGHRSNINKNK